MTLDEECVSIFTNIFVDFSQATVSARESLGNNGNKHSLRSTYSQFSYPFVQE
jgi:hypothetical protein